MRCDHKRTYRTRKNAKRAGLRAFSHGSLDGGKPRAYLCDECGMFHLTTQDGTTRGKYSEKRSLYG